MDRMAEILRNLEIAKNAYAWMPHNYSVIATSSVGAHSVIIIKEEGFNGIVIGNALVYSWSHISKLKTEYDKKSELLRRLIIKTLIYDEGVRNRVYLCSTDHPTIGVGYKLGPQCTEEEKTRFYGDLYWDQETCENMLNSCVKWHEFKLNSLNWFVNLDVEHQCAIINMSYQIGFNGLMGFKKSVEHLKAGNVQDAAFEIMDSLWAKKQSPARAKRIQAVLLNKGVLNVYGFQRI